VKIAPLFAGRRISFLLYALEKEKPRVSKATSKMVLSNRETFYISLSLTKPF